MFSNLRDFVVWRTSLVCGVFLLAFVMVLAACGGKSHVDSAGLVRYGKLSGSAVIRTAKTQIGTKYAYGGTSPRAGFDCSGLIYWSYKQYGVELPRNTSGQARIGHAVSMSRIQHGDIVVFKLGRSRIHTGMYSGGGKFIHSPRTGKTVREERLAAAYWKARLVSVRRVL